MKNYNFQAPTKEQMSNQNGWSWDDCSPVSMEFPTRDEAVRAAKLLGNFAGCMEVRMTECAPEFFSRASGAYIRCDFDKK